MDFDALQRRRGCLCHGQPRPSPFTFDLLNRNRSSVGTNKYSLSVLSKLFKPFMRYSSNYIEPDKRKEGRTDDERTNGTTGQPKNALANNVGWQRHNNTVK